MWFFSLLHLKHRYLQTLCKDRHNHNELMNKSVNFLILPLSV